MNVNWLKTPALALMSALALSAPVVAETSGTATQKEGTMTKIEFIFGEDRLSATLDDTAAGRDFAAMLPLELTLTDYHGVEKVADLPRKLDTTGAPASYKPETGDITLYAPWGNLAIFYKPFQNSRGLVRLGAFDGDIAPLVRSAPYTVRIEIAD
ncbi:cyclophilin-like fold protein [Phaeobacter gallaeciensis]|jgi:hypothetical protein|uniref:cyclophilin-like fold protein n=1 Tax=Phaeobacter gallaeciensis TaxID=60890 RepID=UPI00237FF4D1|nr:cyclophilin-like fold protein [Phaeobacter gallaeciensis]MDE4274403.1 cyclophilin-like fold protein [Phaeobacter gallaeciensis]MDE4299642.1 cyclophilin-like fold protein [Phaeobacter gallaeciensis]MDE5184807.1 cyclophilin-like fold protein [Phaeobacter gallaeciensis]